MYHRFHASFDCDVKQVTYISGDTWNVNPIALERVREIILQKRDSAVIKTQLTNLKPYLSQWCQSLPFWLPAFACTGILDVLLHLKYLGPNVIKCNARFSKGQEMG